MNPDVIQFSCGACQHVLTVPAQLAGISGPCPVCGNTVTSPPAQAAPAAPAFFAPPAFGPSAPMPQQAPPAMPQPGGFGGQMSGGLGLPPQQPAFPSAPQAAPSWQAPGLGQTIIETSQSPGTMPMSMQPPAQPESFLPPRRNDGQIPFSGSLGSSPVQMAAPAQPMWGAGLASAPASPMSEMPPLPRQAGPQGHSNLIPGSPTLPMMTDSPQAGGGTLLGRGGLPSTPLNPMAQNGDFANSGGLSLPTAVASSRGGASRPMRKPKRSSNIFMIGLAILLLGGCLATAGWLFREPLLIVVEKAKASLLGQSATPIEVAAEPLKEPATLPEPAPKADETPKGESKVAFDPDEKPSPSEIAPSPPAGDPNMVEVRKPEALKPGELPAEGSVSGLAPAPVSTPQTPNSLVEVAPKPGSMTETSPTPAPDVADTLAASREVRLDDVTEEARPAAEALKKFLSAANLQDRMEHTLASDIMRPIMERYYTSNPPGPITVDAIALVRYDPKPQIGGGAHAVFGMESKTWEFPVPVMLEMNEGRFKVDWLSFIEFKDRLLEKFLQGYQDGAARFHVGMTRTHYFEDKVPNSSGKDAFRISPAPPNPFASVVFVDRESDLGRELRDKIPWGAQVWAIVELEWTKLGTQSWVNLSAVPQLNWYSVPSAPKAVRAGTPSSSSVNDNQAVPTETQKAVPIGR